MFKEQAEDEAKYREFIEKVIARFEGLLQKMGAENFEGGIDTTVRVLEFYLDELRKMRTKEEMRLILAQMPRASRPKRQLVLGVLKYFPQIFSYGIKQLASGEGYQLPAIPQGRPRVELQQKAEVAAYMGMLIVERKLSKEVAKKRAARRFGISESTVQRAWDDRIEESDADFHSSNAFFLDLMAGKDD
jgi:hypothetical protein